MCDEPIHLRNTALAITERCTLRCKLCFAYIPYHKNPKDMTLTDVETVLKRYFSLVASVDFFCITGGEPLLHPQLVPILEELGKYDSQIIERIDLITNGTIDISSDLMQFLAKNKDRVRIIVSNYGMHSPKANLITEKLAANNVCFRTEEYNGDNPLHGGWLDCREHKLKHLSQEDVDAQGLSCYFKNKRGYTIRKGELHNCGRSYWRMLNGIIPRNKNEYINLLDTSSSILDQRRVLRKLHDCISVTSCAYCDSGADRKRYAPAEQL